MDRLDVVATFERGIGPIKVRDRGAGAGVIARAYRLLAPARRVSLVGVVSVDMDSTDVGVYGSRKQGVAYNDAGQRAGRPHLATWAEAGLTMAAGLLAGNDDVRPRAAGMLRRAAGGVPEPVLSAMAEAGSRPRVRADTGYLTGDLAHAAVEAGCDFARIHRWS